MLYTDLIAGQTYVLEVIKEKSKSKYYRVKTEDGVEFSILKFKHQLDQPVPDTLVCYVKSLYPLTIRQDIANLIHQYYVQDVEYDFIIKDIKYDDCHVVYEVGDSHDLSFRLYNAPEALEIGRHIKCKVVRIKGVNVMLKYVGTLSTKLPIEFHDIYDWLMSLGITRCHDHYLSLLESVPEFETCLTKYDEDDASWILELLQTISVNVPKWLTENRKNKAVFSKIINRMRLAKRLLMFILEESDYLRNCNSEQRALVQSRLSEIAEQFDRYEKAGKMILSGTYEEFIDQMLNRLKLSGFLYQPSRQFMIMRTILRLRPELINSRMGELFETLHNWEEANWKSDPFRGALVEQLQIFIKEYSGQANTLPANDSSEDNKTIVRIILAIAVQSLLASHEDDVNLSINRAMLYRYISYLNPENIRILFDKSVDSILGISRKLEYTWKDTEQPTLLILKSSHPDLYISEGQNVVKKYSNSKASVVLRPNHIQIVARDADPDSTSIPNNLMDWLNPAVSVTDDIKSIKKVKDLRAYKSMWNDISWSIFGEEETVSEGVVEKRLPEDMEEVRVVIDGVRFLKTGPEKQRLQFHCTIHDDIYKGDGWMPSDSYHMIGWLSQFDYPGNYDGSVKFAQTVNGTPLSFPATVLRRGGELIFSMKDQIDEYLLDTSAPGDESVCIITHFDRTSNAWLCLSEKGCTFKVPLDDETSELNIGMLVRIRYIEPDRSIPKIGTKLKFFIGELSENQDDIPFALRKSQCLANLMRGFGLLTDVSTKEDNEVLGYEEVLSAEELMEIIYMFQRLAYTEIEYIKAFNYLGFASVLCKLVDNQELLKDIETHMELLVMLQDFGRNQYIDNDSINATEDRSSRSPLLERLHTRLKIVADMKDCENVEWLWHLVKDCRNDIECRLASLVLSYKMLPHELEKSREEIMKEITTLLNVNNTAPTSKYYGDESQTVEFKSSLIFSSRGGSRPDYKEQIREITHVICGFMNARGGWLYIGVNDTGYENGLADDLNYRRTHGFKDTIDSMMVDLQNHLDRVLPYHAKDHWEIMSDPESKKGVIMVRVLPVEQPVEFEDIIYVRSSSTTKPRLGQQRDEFIKSRKHNYELMMKVYGLASDEEKEDENCENTTLSQEESYQISSFGQIHKRMDEVKVEIHSNDNTISVCKKIHTGLHRTNILHDYDYNFVQPASYLYFKKDQIVVRENDAYIDSDEDCRLALALKMNEKDGYMVFGYSDGSVARVAVSSLIENIEANTHVLPEEPQLNFVNICKGNDFLLSVIKSTSGGMFYRLNPVSEIPLLNDCISAGIFLCNNDYYLMAQDIVSPDKLTFFDKDSISKDPRYYGVSVSIGNGTMSEQERISELIRPVISQE